MHRATKENHHILQPEGQEKNRLRELPVLNLGESLYRFT